MDRAQKGFTLLEMLVALAIGGVLLTGLVISIFQTFAITQQDTTAISGFDNVKNAAFEITRDVKKSSATDILDGGPAADSLALSWTIWYDQDGNLIPDGQPSTCEYSLSGTDLQRVLNGGAPRTVGRYITAVQFSRLNNMITVSITASPESRTETAVQQTYYVFLQAKEPPVR